MNNIPTQPYGYFPPKLGGEGMGNYQDGDIWFKDNCGWKPKKIIATVFMSDVYYTRPINPGKGKRIVGEDEIPAKNGCEYYDGKSWKIFSNISNYTTKNWRETHQGLNICAIRIDVCPKCNKSDASTNPIPNWRVIDECDLKIGENFWRMDCDNDVDCYVCDTKNIKYWLEYKKIKRWMRCEGNYQVPPPAKLEPDSGKDNKFKEWLRNYNYEREDYGLRELSIDEILAAKSAWLAAQDREV